MLDLRAFMFERVYLGPAAEEQRELAVATIRQDLRPARRASRGAPAGPARRPSRAGHRLRRRHDRPLRARMAHNRPGLDRPGEGGRRHGRDRRRAHPAPEGRARGGRGRCPFHEERTPSFSVNAVDKLFYCFGCGKEGDLITFVQETEGLDFVRRDRVAGRALPHPARVRGDVAAGRGEARAPRAAALAPRAGGALLRALPLGVGRRRRVRVRVPGGARPAGRRSAASTGSGSRPGGAVLAEKARGQGLRAGRARRRRPRQPPRQRLLRRPARLPARRRARPRARLRRAPHARGRPHPGEVRELARGRALPQGLDRLRARPRPGGDHEGGPRARRRGLHGRPRAPPGGARLRRSPRWERRSPSRSSRSFAASPATCTSASTPTRPARRRRMRGMELAVRAGFDVRIVPLPAGLGSGRRGRRLRGRGSADSVGYLAPPGRRSSSPTRPKQEAFERVQTLIDAAPRRARTGRGRAVRLGPARCAPPDRRRQRDRRRRGAPEAARRGRRGSSATSSPVVRGARPTSPSGT